MLRQRRWAPVVRSEGDYTCLVCVSTSLVSFLFCLNVLLCVGMRSTFISTLHLQNTVADPEIRNKGDPWEFYRWSVDHINPTMVGAEVTSTKSTALLKADDEVLFVTDPRGFKFIFNESISFLYDDPAFECRLQLNKIVTAVNYEGDRVVVTCKDGTTFTGDNVLMTFSLGVLQNGVVDFQPELPEWKIEELYQFIMADFTKIFMKFDTQFWPDEEWFIHAHERRGYFPVFYNLEAKGLFPKGTNMLAAFVSGNEAKRIEQQPNSETSAEITNVLRTIFGNEVIPPTEIIHSGWSINPFTYGAYSNWPVEVSEECFKKIESRVGPIFFGGEHTDPIYNGYIIGGELSGKREAMKILDCMNLRDVDECPIWQEVKKADCDCTSGASIITKSVGLHLVALPVFLVLMM
ncbi:polyamine oxidase 6-like isoform X2 [Anneissia japonica]|uniref:polyamine oxidase 6-like isoform X2 n=1 Tax=Anneissia japonica TaxID=1529436 RepID=UPI001425A923|nr:polyamine oxidase 6-like isoform X2 [Anneissia japonica]